MSSRSLPARALQVVVLGAAGAVAVLGGLTLAPYQAVAVGLCAVVAAGVGASVVRESAAGVSPRRAVDVAWRCAAGTVAGLLVLAGLAAIGGGWLAAVGGLAGVTVAALVVAFRATRAGVPPRVDDGEPPTLVPVSELSTEALGREWQRTAGALAAALEPATRQHVVRRRQDTLDELERRDPEGFARWLTEGARSDSDPAGHISGDTAAGPG